MLLLLLLLLLGCFWVTTWFATRTMCVCGFFLSLGCFTREPHYVSQKGQRCKHDEHWVICTQVSSQSSKQLDLSHSGKSNFFETLLFYIWPHSRSYGPNLAICIFFPLEYGSFGPFFHFICRICNVFFLQTHVCQIINYFSIFHLKDSIFLKIQYFSPQFFFI